jgi:hypothetical protein
MTTSTPFWDLLHAENYDMGPTAVLLMIFFRPKSPSASAGFETAN